MSSAISAAIAAALLPTPQFSNPQPTGPALSIQPCWTSPSADVCYLGVPNVDYADPEVHPTLPQLVFQSGGSIWIGDVDPATGNFVTPSGQDVLVADDAMNVIAARNGPEYGYDAGGYSIFYNGNTAGFYGTVATAVVNRAALDGSSLGLDNTLPGQGSVGRVNQLPSQSGAYPYTHVMCARATAPGLNEITRFNELFLAGESVLTPLAPDTGGFRWSRGSMIYTSTSAYPDSYGEVLLGDVAAGAPPVVVTDDQFTKFDPYGWDCPEEGTHAFVARITDSILAVYVKSDVIDNYYVRKYLLPPPSSSEMRYPQSAEPFVVGGKSYISLTLKREPYPIYNGVSESEIWVYDLEGGQWRYDDGDTAPRIRHEAETLVGDDWVYLYYNELINGNEFRLVRVRTDIRAALP